MIYLAIINDLNLDRSKSDGPVRLIGKNKLLNARFNKILNEEKISAFEIS